MTGKWKTILREDCFRYCGETGLSARLRVYLVHAAYRYTCLLRKTQYHKEAGHRLRTKWHRLRLLRSSIRYGYQINPEAQIGKGLYIGHRGTVIINGEAVILTGYGDRSGKQGKARRCSADRKPCMDRRKCCCCRKHSNRRRCADRTGFLCKLRCAVAFYCAGKSGKNNRAYRCDGGIHSKSCFGRAVK